MESRRLKGWLCYGLLAVLTIACGLFGCKRAAAVKIADLRPAMGATIVQVAGHVAGSAQVSRDAGKISGLRFEVADDTGQIAVTADAQQARQLAIWDRIPRAGDKIGVTGRLGAESADHLILRLVSDKAFTLHRRHARQTVVAPATNVTRPATVPLSSDAVAKPLRP